MVYLVSACLLGLKTRYDGESAALRGTLAVPLGRLLPICPEQLGGLPTPRCPAEIAGGDGSDVLAGRAGVWDGQGRDVTGAFLRGARETLFMGRLYSIQGAYFKDKSPSCGSSCIFDGSFCGRLRQGAGVTAALLKEHGIPVFPETDLGFHPVD